MDVFTKITNKIGTAIAANSHKNILEYLHKSLDTIDNIYIVQLLEHMNTHGENELANKILTYCFNHLPDLIDINVNNNEMTSKYIEDYVKNYVNSSVTASKKTNRTPPSMPSYNSCSCGSTCGC